MTSTNLIAILPFLILAAGITLAMLAIAIRRSLAVTAGISFVTLLLSFISIPVFAVRAAGPVTMLFSLDGYAYTIFLLILAASFVVALLAYRYLQIHAGQADEFYLLLLLATLGGGTLAASSHFASFFLGLEILSISLYALIGYAYDSPISVEAGVKYLILAGSSSAFLLFGMALIYAELGTMEFTGVAHGLASIPAGVSPVYLLAGFVLMLVAFGFKLALAPFHMWTPDVYEGAPAPVTAFVASVSKGSMFAVLLRFFGGLNLNRIPSLQLVFILVAVITMLVGSLLALRQNNLKRLLAYSSIANLGYLLVAFLAGGSSAMTASTFFLVSYFVTILAAFGVVTVLSGRSRDAQGLEEYRGLMWRRPWLAAVLTVAMFSLAGLPLTVGFMGKFYLVLAGVGAAQWVLVIALVISSAIGLYYYLRVVVSLFRQPLPATGAPAEAGAPALSPVSGVTLAGLLVLMIWLGIYPTPLIEMIQAIAPGAR